MLIHPEDDMYNSSAGENQYCSTTTSLHGSGKRTTKMFSYVNLTTPKWQNIALPNNGTFKANLTIRSENSLYSLECKDSVRQRFDY